MSATQITPISFIALPQEILLHIIDFALPYDILSLRNTCKTIHPLTRARSVWANAVRKMCFEKALFAPTYDLTQLSRLHLEHAATASRRFSKLLINNGSSNLEDA
ncbi:uncharacterized protein SCHCODRAFT_02594272 [Schizophyllum commune H4-8]|uniref:uncharacterized protein n=1 Tax=Schizophyllum commune (strain H4-8 / FGSC 9210) TaxID=578458 RepID=UPI00215F0ED6|nr:uncharacterized protein SCHCODRAFT_02594272 [Schizophyllum commune H4-8]KAI5885073.1 hypothetical protein SCHCODRAFT_02594272 [Schizophyllum commune H4-8]